MPETPVTGDDELPSWPAHGGPMAERIRAHDWSATPLGPIEGWPQSLRTAVDLMLSSAFAATLHGGPDLVVLYNDVFASLFGLDRSDALGRPARDVFPETAAQTEAVMRRVRAGETFVLEDEPFRLLRNGAVDDRWFTLSHQPVRDDGGAVIAMLVVGVETTGRVRMERERDRTEQALRASEERQAFLLKLSDALRPLADPIDIQNVAMRLLGEHFVLARAFYLRAERDETGWVHIVESDYHRMPGMRSVVGRHPLKDFGSSVYAGMERGRIVQVPDVRALPSLTPAELESYDAFDLRAFVHVPLIKADQYVAAVCVHDSSPRDWTADEIALIRDVAERTWDAVERTRAEEALRGREEQQAFLLKLSDTLRPFGDPIDVIVIASEALGQHLGVGRCGYGEVDATGEFFVVERDWTDGRMASFRGKHRLVDFGPEFTAAYRAGRSVLIDDAPADARAQGAEAAFEAAGGVRASLGVPLIKDGRFVAGLFAQQVPPRRWSAADEALVRDVGERIWAAVERARAEAVLRESEDRFRTLAESIEDVFYMTDLDRNALLYLSPSYERVWGQPMADLMRDLDSFIDTVHPDDQTRFFADKAAQARGEPVAAEYRIVRANGEVRWILDRSFPVSANGTRRSAGVASDITLRKRAEAALRESETRFRQFGEASQDVLWIRDAETLQWEYLTPAFETIYGLSRDEALSGNNFRNWAELIVPEDRERAVDDIRRVGSGERVTFEYRIRRPRDGQVRWLRNTDFPIRDEAGRVVRIGGIGHDVTDMKRAEERQTLLLAELQHRVRNTLAMIRSVAGQTATTSETVEGFANHLEGRIGALARTQVLLTRNPGIGIDLESLVREELLAQAAVEEQVAVAGPSVALAPKAAEVLTLAVHELATNATKYGALAQAQGRVEVAWRVEPQGPGSPAWLHLAWRESGVAVLGAAPRRTGFGVELITRRVPYELDGRGTFELRPGGVTCTIDFPLRPGASILETDAASLAGGPRREAPLG